MLISVLTFTLSANGILALSDNEIHDNNEISVAKVNAVSFSETENDLDNGGLEIETSLETEVVEYEESDMTYLAAQAEGMDLEEQGRVMEAVYKWKARHWGYVPASGATLDWEAAQVYRNGVDFIIDVPFVEGMDLVSKVLFTWNREGVHTQEIFSVMEESNQVHVFSWIDGEAVVDTVIVNEDIDSPSVVTAGMVKTVEPMRGPNWGVLIVV